MSSDIFVTARRLSDKNEVEIKNIKNLSVKSVLESPARSFSCEFACDGTPQDYGEVKAYYKDRLIFSGKTDSQKHRINYLGSTVQLDARSAGAALIDNQALPTKFMSVSLNTIYKRCIEPYGFSLYAPNRGSFLPMYTISAGMCEWDALVEFCRRAFNLTPYVTGGQIMVDRHYSAAPLIISNSGDGLGYTAITHTRTPYNVLSKVVLRNNNGNYALAVHNPDASYLGVSRKRYVVPATEYADRLDLDANQRIRRSMFAYEKAEITLPGFHEAALARDVLVRDAFIRLSNLMVTQHEYSLGENGEVTNLVLQSSVYYD